MTNREPANGSLAALLCALSFTTGLALGERLDRGLKSAYLGMRLADALGLPNEVPLPARILHPAQMLELTHSFGGPPAAKALARGRRGTRFDPEVAGAFLALAERDDFWGELEQESAQAALLAMSPPTPADRIGGDQIDAVCDALAEFADLKTQQTWHHSSAVAYAVQQGLA